MGRQGGPRCLLGGKSLEGGQAPESLQEGSWGEGALPPSCGNIAAAFLAAARAGKISQNCAGSRVCGTEAPLQFLPPSNTALGLDHQDPAFLGRSSDALVSKTLPRSFANEIARTEMRTWNPCYSGREWKGKEWTCNSFLSQWWRNGFGSESFGYNKPSRPPLNPWWNQMVDVFLLSRGTS